MKVLFTFGLFALLICSVYGLECYNCNSEDDPSCLQSPTKKHDCSHVIADLSSTRFRCMTIRAGKGADAFVNRRCATDKECDFQVRDGQFSWSKPYTDAQCNECQSDLCNK